MTIRAAILGASGYAGGELLRLLLGHPEAEPVAIVSRTQEGQAVAAVHPHLARLTDLTFAGALPEDDEPDVVFLAGPLGFAAEVAPSLLERGLRVIDLSPDFRIKDPAAFARYYGKVHAAFDHQKKFAYGLPELFRDEIRRCRAVASPGCFATAGILAVAPLWKAGLVAKGTPLSIFAVTGSSGAGASPSATTHHPRRAGAFFAYGLDGHRHQAEIEEALAAIGAPAEGRLLFQTHSAPLVRGIFTTVIAPLAEKMDIAGLRRLYEDSFGKEFFVRLVDGSPDVASVRGTNFADIGLAVSGAVAKVFVAIDNLVKGAAGQAIQAMNILFRLPETAGLKLTGVFP